jgi:hypothetical protein
LLGVLGMGRVGQEQAGEDMCEQWEFERRHCAEETCCCGSIVLKSGSLVYGKSSCSALCVVLCYTSFQALRKVNVGGRSLEGSHTFLAARLNDMFTSGKSNLGVAG